VSFSCAAHCGDVGWGELLRTDQIAGTQYPNVRSPFLVPTQSLYHELVARHLDDQLDLTVLAQLEILITTSRLCSRSRTTIEQTAFVVVIDEQERRLLEARRGVRHAHEGDGARWTSDRTSV
jgi:hypothetical protein